MSIALIDASEDSLTVSWPESEKASRYVLEYRRQQGVDDDNISSPFETLSDKLSTTQAKKKNLTDDNGKGFFFRVGSVPEGSDGVPAWISHDTPFHLLSKGQDQARMKQPHVALPGSNLALFISWEKVDGTSTYELQMRENRGGEAWKTIAPALSASEVRKKNLVSTSGYQFRVRPAASDLPFSSPSTPVVALGLSEPIKRLFCSLENATLLRRSDQPVPLADALGGKEFLLLYASASWCGPCRQLSPALAQWYQSLDPNNKTVEVIFLSADHDENGFKSYYRHMPWLAIDYHDNARETLMAHIRVSTIPRLVVLDAKTGRILEENAVGKPFDMIRWRRLAAGGK